MLSSSRVGRGLRLTALALVAAAFLFRLALLRCHAFNPDEFQHLHGAWCLAKGLLPYRDYFEHHTPWLHLFLAPFLAFFDVETNPASADAFIFFARGWMWVFSGLALALAFRLGRLWDGEAAAWTGIVLLSTTVMFLDKTLEIRPDVPAVAFLLGSWATLLLALRRAAEGRGAHALFARSGLLLGTALLCTQKALFTLPASFAWLAWYLLDPRAARPRAQRLRSVLWHAAGVLAPIVVVLAVFALRDGLGAFVQSNLLVNLRWPVRFSPETLLRQLFRENALVVVLGLAGLVTALLALLRDRGADPGRALVALHALGLGVGVFLIPVPYAQYLVMLLPLLTLLAGSVLVRAVAATSSLRSRPVRLASLAAIAGLVVAASVAPVRIIADMRRPRHTRVQDQLDRLHYVLAASGPQERILDGFSGLGVFRPHAFFHFFLHDEIRTLLGARGRARLFSALRDGVVAPDWVVADEDVRGLPREIGVFLEENYEPAERAPLYRRKDVWLDHGRWLDLGAGPTDVLAGRGWHTAEREGAVTFRRARGRFSAIRLPVRDPSTCRAIVVRARLEHAAEPVAVELAVNGRTIGSIRPSPGWHDHSVVLPTGLLRRGINALRLSYERAPGLDGAHDRGRETPAAVDGLGLDCAGARR